MRGARLHLGVRSRSATGDGDPSQTIVWRGPIPKASRAGRARKCRRCARAMFFGTWGHFVCDARGSLGGFLGACVMWAIEYPKAIRNAELEGSAAHTAVDKCCNTLQKIVGAPMAEPGVVAIGGKRVGVAVVVEVEETLLNKAERTQMRVACRPRQRRTWGAAEEQNGARFALGVLGAAEDAINGRP